MLSNWDQLSNRFDVADKQVRRIVVHQIMAQTATASGADPIGGGSYNPSRVPQNVTYDYVTVVNAKIIWYDPAMVVLQQITPGLEMGQVLLSVDLVWKNLFDPMTDPDNPSYIVVDGKTVRPRTLTLAGVEGNTSLDVLCYSVNAATIARRIKVKG